MSNTDSNIWQHRTALNSMATGSSLHLERCLLQACPALLPSLPSVTALRRTETLRQDNESVYVCVNLKRGVSATFSHSMRCLYAIPCTLWIEIHSLRSFRWCHWFIFPIVSSARPSSSRPSASASQIRQGLSQLQILNLHALCIACLGISQLPTEGLYLKILKATSCKATTISRKVTTLA